MDNHDARHGRLRYDADDSAGSRVFRSLPIIALTAKAMKGDREEVHRSRCFGNYISKTGGPPSKMLAMLAGVVVPIGLLRICTIV